MVPIPLQKDPEWRRWDEATPYTDYHGRKGLPVPLMKFECEGLEPFDFILKGPHWRVNQQDYGQDSLSLCMGYRIFHIIACFKVEKSGIIFENVDLSGGDWAEWDEKMNAPVVITNFKWSLDVVKGWVWYGTRYWK
ncbi:hypothetical protein KSS87_016637 [Heliosperma pusillum]|nr:hypothetical protein KSS87_016637 [Heliosperma pusillum]